MERMGHKVRWITRNTLHKVQLNQNNIKNVTEILCYTQQCDETRQNHVQNKQKTWHSSTNKYAKTHH